MTAIHVCMGSKNFKLHATLKLCSVHISADIRICNVTKRYREWELELEYVGKHAVCYNRKKRDKEEKGNDKVASAGQCSQEVG